MCLYPVTLVRPKDEWQDNQEQSTATRVVPCGKCIKCLKRRSNGWAFRLEQEQKRSTSSAFLTLTYERCPISSNGFQTLVKKDFQDFMKRLRKFISDKYIELGYKSKDEIPSLKYYACGEYGGKTQRPHYHAIMYNLPYQAVNDLQIITSKWQHGYCYIAKSEPASIMYVAKYIQKISNRDISVVDRETGEIIAEDDRVKEFSLMSKHLGSNYLTEAIIEYYRSRMLAVIRKENGVLMSMPRYYKEKIFTKAELRNIAWEFEKLHRLDLNKLTDQEHARIARDRIQYVKDQDRKALKAEKERCLI